MQVQRGRCFLLHCLEAEPVSIRLEEACSVCSWGCYTALQAKEDGPAALEATVCTVIYICIHLNIQVYIELSI